MDTRPSSTALPVDATEKSKVSGSDVLWILLSAFLVTLLANGAMIYFATDLESDFRSLIDALC
jgi:hypothetical protein